MKFSELIAGHDYAVIPSWNYSSREKKDPTRVSRNDVQKATLVSLQKYEYKVHRSYQPDDVEFVKAKQGERAVGYLVRSATPNFPDPNNGTLYWLARPQDIVALYATLEPRWQQEELAEQERVAEQKRQQERAEEERRIAQANKERMEKSLRESLTGILGNRVNEKNVQFDTTYKRVNNDSKLINVVQLELDLLETLIEKVLEAKDMVA